MIYHINEMPQYAEAGVVMPIGDLVEEVGLDMGQFTEAVVDMSTWNDELYGIPLDIHPLGMYYNVDMVEAAGLDPDSPPTNLEEAARMGRSADSGHQWGRRDRSVRYLGAGHQRDDVPLWWGLIFQNGGQFINEDKTEVVIDNPEAAEALEVVARSWFTNTVSLRKGNPIADPTSRPAAWRSPSRGRGGSTVSSGLKA